MQRLGTRGFTDVRWNAWRPAALVALLLIAALFTLLPLAEATPPDQTWISGLYDNGDQDDVVILITGMAVVQAAATPPYGPVTVDVGRVRTLAPPRVADRAPDSRGSRAPPRSHA
jgi:hypothetical protein